jgi:hypothetical protein
MAIFPLFYIIPLVLISIFCSSLLIGLLILLSLPLSGFLTIIYAHAFNRFKAKWKLWVFKSRNPSEFKSISATKTAMDQIITEAKAAYFNVR